MTASSLKPFRVLFVEDSEDDYQLMLAVLARGWPNIESLRVEDAVGMQLALADGSWNAVISDHNLPSFTSGGALATLRESGIDLPFIVVSGELGEEVAVEALLAGADDYLMKSRINRLPRALKRALQTAAIRHARSDAEVSLRLSEAKGYELAKHIGTSQEAERSAVASEIGEEIGSALTAVKFELAWLQRHCVLLPDARERLANAIAMIEQAAASAQRVVGDLRPAILDQGIAPALEWLTSRFSRHSGLKMRFDANREVIPDPDVGIAIYRVCQEALNNVARRPDATRVDVDLFVTKGQIHLEVTDDGSELVLPEDASVRLGMASMHERARNFNGTLDISSREGRGTTVLLSLPLAGKLTDRSTSQVTGQATGKKPSNQKNNLPSKGSQ